MKATTANPVEQIRVQAKRLEAALTVCAATPTVKAVHELRSSTRRVQSQLELLDTVKGLPRYRSKAEKVLKRLARLRRLSGDVRDCDVQQKLLDDRSADLSSAPESSPEAGLLQHKLSERLGALRQRRQEKLLEGIERESPRLTRDTEKLLSALKPAAELEVDTAAVLDSIRARMSRVLSSRTRGESHLHEIRKLAKRARYQCESMPGPPAAALARRLEQLQDAGGVWHDLLDLTTRCHKEIGAEHPFSRALEHCRDEALDLYLENLDDLRKQQRHRGTKSHKPHKPARRKLKPAKSVPGSAARRNRQPARAARTMTAGAPPAA